MISKGNNEFAKVTRACCQFTGKQGPQEKLPQKASTYSCMENLSSVMYLPQMSHKLTDRLLDAAQIIVKLKADERDFPDSL